MYNPSNAAAKTSRVLRYILHEMFVFCPNPGQFISITGTALAITTGDCKLQCLIHSIIVQ